VIPTDRHLVLVGLMGVGKTTVSHELGRRLGRRVLDSDEVIEAATGRTVREIFEADGEAAFRDLEAAALAEALADPDPLVIAAAGGVVLREANREALRRARAVVVWLTAPADVLAERAARGDHRPLLDGDPEGVLRRMHHDREALYREVADRVVAVDGRTPDEVVEAILS
jgi:shikimate kinase